MLTIACAIENGKIRMESFVSKFLDACFNEGGQNFAKNKCFQFTKVAIKVCTNG